MDPVGEILRETDRERYFATLVLPELVRTHAQALFAFSADVSAIAARVSDPNAGEIRLQWWTDALEGRGHGDVDRNPLASALLAAIATFNLPRPPLLRLIRARRFDLYADPMPDVTSFEGYAGETVSILHQFVAMMLNGGAEPEGGDAAGHLGVAQALIGHIRALGYHASRGRIFLPWSVLAANGVAESEVLSGQSSEGLLAALQQLRELADEHMAKARTSIAAVPRQLRPAFAPLALLSWELRASDSEAPFAPPRQRADWRKIAALSWWTWRNV
jgi:phytoene synthase